MATSTETKWYYPIQDKVKEYLKDYFTDYRCDWQDVVDTDYAIVYERYSGFVDNNGVKGFAIILITLHKHSKSFQVYKLIS